MNEPVSSTGAASNEERLLSVVVPVYNEGDSVLDAYDAISSVLTSALPGWCIRYIFVDDGSRDDTFRHLSALAGDHENVTVIKFAGNCGAHMAIRSGLEHAYDGYACFISCDLQDPPKVIPELLKQCTGSVQIVWGVVVSRKDSLATRLFARLFYFLARLIVSRNIPPGGANIFLLGPKALKAVRLYSERNLTLLGLAETMGFQMGFVPYHREERTTGSSKWTVRKKLKLFGDFFVGSSYIPIRLMSYAGIVTAFCGFLYALFIIAYKLFFGNTITGWPSLMTVVLLLGGLQMIMLGVLGEYLWRTLDEVRGRPNYIIETTLSNQTGGEKTFDQP